MRARIVSIHPPRVLWIRNLHQFSFFSEELEKPARSEKTCTALGVYATRADTTSRRLCLDHEQLLTKLIQC